METALKQHSTKTSGAQIVAPKRSCPNERHNVQNFLIINSTVLNFYRKLQKHTPWQILFSNTTHCFIWTLMWGKVASGTWFFVQKITGIGTPSASQVNTTCLPSFTEITRCLRRTNGRCLWLTENKCTHITIQQLCEKSGPRPITNPLCVVL